ncbi:hypothetical protein OT109_01435 [Phycisphaeraceae bacterium D3-23]
MTDRPPIVAITYPRCPSCNHRLDRDTMRRYGKRHDPSRLLDYWYGVCLTCGCKVRVFEVAEDSCDRKPAGLDAGTMPA